MILRLAVALLAGVVYVNALHNPFIYDDYSTVVSNGSIVSPVTLRGVLLHDVKRPVVNASYAIDRQLWGARPTGFHATNVAIHVVNVLLLFALASALLECVIGDSGRSASSRALAAFAAASLLAVHPMMTEAVGYISGRSELLCTAFVLASLWCGLRWIRDGRARWTAWAAFTVVFWIGGLLSKETAAVMPLLLAAADRLTATDRGEFRRRLWMFHLPLFGVAVAAGLFRLAILVAIERSGEATIRLPLVLIALDVMVQYLRLLIVPMNQTLFHSITAVRGIADPRALGALVVVAAMVMGAWRLRRVDSVAAFGLLTFLLLLVPGAVLTAMNVGEPMAEHRVYLASVGLFLAIGSGIGWIADWAVNRLPKPRVWVGALLGIVLLAYAGETVQRNVIWSDPITVWQESVALAPNHPRPRMLLGEALEGGGRRTEALEQYQTAVRLEPADPTAQLKLGLCLAAMGRYDEARRALEETTRLDPGNEPARRALRLLGQMKPVA